jgi:hypothetical protein
MIHPIPESTASTSLSHRSPITDRNSIGSCYTDVSFETYPALKNTLSASRLCGTTTMIMPKVYNPLCLTTNHNQNSSSSPVINTDIIPSAKQHSPSRSSPMLFSTHTNGQSTPSHHSSQHIKTMKGIQTSSSSLSDFISSPLQNISEYMCRSTDTLLEPVRSGSGSRNAWTPRTPQFNNTISLLFQINVSFSLSWRSSKCPSFFNRLFADT